MLLNLVWFLSGVRPETGMGLLPRMASDYIIMFPVAYLKEQMQSELHTLC